MPSPRPTAARSSAPTPSDVKSAPRWAGPWPHSLVGRGHGHQLWMRNRSDDDPSRGFGGSTPAPVASRPTSGPPARKHLGLSTHECSGLAADRPADAGGRRAGGPGLVAEPAPPLDRRGGPTAR